MTNLESALLEARAELQGQLGLEEAPEAIVLFWIDPAGDPKAAAQARWDAIAEALASRPGEWARIDTGYAKSHAGNTPAAQCMKNRGLEARVRKMADGTRSTWAMYPPDLAR